jgi:hypothetical protein
MPLKSTTFKKKKSQGATKRSEFNGVTPHRKPCHGINSPETGFATLVPQ